MQNLKWAIDQFGPKRRALVCSQGPPHALRCSAVRAPARQMSPALSLRPSKPAPTQRGNRFDEIRSSPLFGNGWQVHRVQPASRRPLSASSHPCRRDSGVSKPRTAVPWLLGGLGVYSSFVRRSWSKLFPGFPNTRLVFRLGSEAHAGSQGEGAATSQRSHPRDPGWRERWLVLNGGQEKHPEHQPGGSLPRMLFSFITVRQANTEVTQQQGSSLIGSSQIQ